MYANGATGPAGRNRPTPIDKEPYVVVYKLVALTLLFPGLELPIK